MSKFLTVKNEVGSPEILIHGPIGQSFYSDEGVTGEDFTNALNKFPKGSKVTIGINSEGGSVGEGLAIYNAIARRAEDITCRVDGYALSIASVFMQAASKRIIPKSAIVMIHKASMFSGGNSDQHRRDAEMLDIHDDVICTAYCMSTGKEEREIMKAMDAETWFSGEDAVAYGLGDDLSNDPVVFDPMPASNSDRFKNCPDEFKVILNSGARIYHADLSKISAPKNSGAANDKTPPNMKNQILASLKKLGIDVAENATDEQLVALLEKHMAKTESPKNKSELDNQNSSAIMAKLEDLLAKNLEEKRKRIRAEVVRRGENKIANEQIDRYVKLGMDDEDGTMAMIDAMHAALPGATPLSGGLITSVESPLDKLSTMKKVTDRVSFLKNDWQSIMQDAKARDSRGSSYAGPVNFKRITNWYADNGPGQDQMRRQGLPQNANTYSGTLVTAFLVDGAITTLQNRWAPLKAFTRDFGTDPYKPKATAEIKFVASTTAAQTNVTNFESSFGDTVNPITVTVSQFTKSFGVSNSDLNSGLRMENLTTINIAGIADAIIQQATAPITAANFVGQANNPDAVKRVIAPGSFKFSDLQNIWAALKKSPIKNILLDGEYLNTIINQPTFFQIAGEDENMGDAWRAFGWDFIALNTNWTGADPNVRGFACNPQAIACVNGLPLVPPSIPGNTLQMSSFEVPGVEINVALFEWFSLATRTMFCSYDAMFGSALADPAGGSIIFGA